MMPPDTNRLAMATCQACKGSWVINLTRAERRPRVFCPHCEHTVKDVLRPPEAHIELGELEDPYLVECEKKARRANALLLSGIALWGVAAVVHATAGHPLSSVPASIGSALILASTILSPDLWHP